MAAMAGVRSEDRGVGIVEPSHEAPEGGAFAGLAPPPGGGRSFVAPALSFSVRSEPDDACWIAAPAAVMAVQQSNFHAPCCEACGKQWVKTVPACVRVERARVGEEHDSDAGSTVSRGNPIGEAEAKPA